MRTLLEQTKEILKNDLQNYPIVLHDPIRDARTGQKIEKYIYACILSRLDPLANALYRFYDYLMQNKYLDEAK